MPEPFDKLTMDEQTPADRLALARALLTPKARPDPAWAALGAAALFAVSAMVFAVGAITAPPTHVSPIHRAAER